MGCVCCWLYLKTGRKVWKTVALNGALLNDASHGLTNEAPGAANGFGYVAGKFSVALKLNRSVNFLNSCTSNSRMQDKFTMIMVPATYSPACGATSEPCLAARHGSRVVRLARGCRHCSPRFFDGHLTQHGVDSVRWLEICPLYRSADSPAPNQSA